MLFQKAKNNNVEFIRLTPTYTVAGTLIVKNVDRLSLEDCKKIQEKENIQLRLPGKQDSKGNLVFIFLQELNFNNACEYYQTELDSCCVRIERTWQNGTLEKTDISEKKFDSAVDELPKSLKYTYTGFNCRVIKNLVDLPVFPPHQDTDNRNRSDLPPVCSIS